MAFFQRSEMTELRKREKQKRKVLLLKIGFLCIFCIIFQDTVIHVRKVPLIAKFLYCVIGQIGAGFRHRPAFHQSKNRP